MKKLLLLSTAVLVLASLGCSSSSSSREEASGKPTKAAATTTMSDLDVPSVRVFVDGRDRGIMPKTVRVKRGFGDAVVTLRRGKEVLRKFEVEILPTSATSDAVFDLRTSNRSQFNLSDLRKLKNGTYIVPFLPYAFQVDDHEYGLTMMIEE